MSRQNRTFVVLVIAVATASAATYGVFRAIQRIPVRNVEVATTFTVVAAKPLPMGSLLTPQDVRLVAWPARTPLVDGFTEAGAVVGRGLLAAVVENEPLVESKLAPKGSGAGLPPSIPPGMRAMSVKVNEVVGVAGFVVPGTRVDVMVTIRQREDSMSRVVVSNVQVLTAGTRYDQGRATKEGKPIPSTVVTLMVTPPDAERIALAQSEGQIMLALRNPTDSDPTVTAGIRTAGLLGAPEPQAPPRPAGARRPAVAPTEPKPESAAVPAVYTVEAIRAAKRTEEVVR